MIQRRNYRACLKEHVTIEELKKAVRIDSEIVRTAIEQKKCLTVAMYYHEDMIFLYTEGLGGEADAGRLFPNVSKLLELWPQKGGKIPWVKMYTIYYHAIPEDEKAWIRQGKKIRRGRIAYLKEDKLFSYTYYHKAIVDEGLLEGDKYQFIALHEDILFSYFEEPKQLTHIKKDIHEESKVIKEWLAVDPESHFDHTLSGEENFLLLPEVFSMGLEDSMENP